MTFHLSITPSYVFSQGSSLCQGPGQVNLLVKKRAKTIRSEAAKAAIRPMNSGNGFHSYTKNSSYQRKAIEAVKELINMSIIKELEIKNLTSLKTFSIADFGCSVGINTLLVVENIIDAIEEKFQSIGQAHNLPDFHVFFNDQVSNDFNHLFISLPPKMRYFAAGVPGSFYDRLFPKDSLNFVHSSFALHWLSRTPEDVLDKNSLSWNKGRVHYSNSSPRVIKAFASQFFYDLGKFLDLRAHEIVQGGLLALILPGRQNGTPHSKAFINHAFELLESALLDMHMQGKINEEKILSYNIALYFASLEEVESVVHQNKYFSLEIMENIPHEKPPPEVMSSTIRAVMERTIKEHFGEEVSDELFGSRLPMKFKNSAATAESCESFSLFILLKRV